MGGMVVVAIRKHGRTSVRLMPKYQGALPTFGSFAPGTYRQETSFGDDWKRAVKVPLAPKHYGLVVVDYDTRWVGSCSDYAGQHEAMFQLNRDYHMQDLVALWAQGRVEGVGLASSGGADIPITLPKGPMTVERLRQAVARAGGDVDSASLFVELRPPQGWVFEDYSPDEASDLAGMIEAMETRGLLRNTPELVAAWRDYFRDKELEGDPMAAWLARVQAEQIEQATAEPALRRGRLSL